MPWISQGDPYETPLEDRVTDYSRLGPGIAQGSEKQAKQSWAQGVGGLGTVASEGQYEGSSALQQSLYQTATSTEFGDPLSTPAGSVPSPMMQPEDYNPRFAPVGPDGKVVPIGDKPMPEGVAKIIGQAKKEELEREAVLSRYADQYAWPIRFATGVAASLVDPLNDAAMFVPGVGEESMMARMGGTFAGRTAARALSGAATGIAAQAPLSALRYGLADQEGQDYDLRDAFRDMAYGAASVAILHSGLGALGELGGKNYRSATEDELAKDFEARNPNFGQEPNFDQSAGFDVALRNSETETPFAAQNQSEAPPNPQDQYRAEAEAQRAENQARQQQQDRARARDRARQERAQAEKAEAEAKAQSTEPQAAPLDENGRFPVDDNGHVLDVDGNPIKFYTPNQAARWIVKKGHQESVDQIFEPAVHPQDSRALTARQRGIADVEDTSPSAEAETIINADPEVRANATRSAVAQIMDGRPVDVTALLDTKTTSPSDLVQNLRTQFQQGYAQGIPQSWFDAVKFTIQNQDKEKVVPINSEAIVQSQHSQNLSLTRIVRLSDGTVRTIHLPDENHAALWNYAEAEQRSRKTGSKEQLGILAKDIAARFKGWPVIESMQGQKFRGARGVADLANEYREGVIDQARNHDNMLAAVVIDPDAEADYLRAGYGRNIPSAPAGPFQMVSPDDVHLDPKRFQYKASDEKGVTGALQGIEQWEPAFANPITVWKSNDGKMYVVNGHQRTDLARRAQAAGQKDIQIPARIYNEAEGYTPEFMRALGAYQNIAEGSGTAIDAAKVLREKIPTARRLPDLPPKSQLVEQAKGLAELGNHAWGMIINEIVPSAYGAEVGRAIKDPAEQVAAMDVLAKAHPPNIEQARMIVRDVVESGFLKGEQSNLFGTEALVQGLFAERARILDNALRSLRQMSKTFNTAIEHEGVLSKVGNVLSKEANTKGKMSNDAFSEILKIDGTRRGPISDALTRAATELKSGQSIAAATRGFIETVRSLGEPVGGAKPGNASESVRPRPDIGGNGPSTERTASGEQHVIPGTEKSAKQAAQSREDAGRGKIKPGEQQKVPDEGLFAPRPDLDADLFNLEEQITHMQESGTHLDPQDEAIIARTDFQMQKADDLSEAYDQGGGCLSGQ